MALVHATLSAMRPNAGGRAVPRVERMAWPGPYNSRYSDTGASNSLNRSEGFTRLPGHRGLCPAEMLPAVVGERNRWPALLATTDPGQPHTASTKKSGTPREGCRR